MSFRVLDVGCKNMHNPERVFAEHADLQVVGLDIDPEMQPGLLHDMRQPLPEEHQGVYDVVYCSHMLEHIGWREVLPTLKHISEGVAPGGKLVVIVPDLEWACAQVLRRNFNFGVLGILWGGQMNEWEHHRSGFTESGLQVMFRRIGFQIVSLVHEPFLAIIDGHRDTCYQISVVAEREA